MADPHKRYLKNPKRNEQKAKFGRLEVVVFIGVMLAIVPKVAKWWLDSSPT